MVAAVQVTITLLLNQQNQNPKRGGSTIGQQEIWRNWLQGHQQLSACYTTGGFLRKRNVGASCWSGTGLV
jgi:hypothetical protein